jgi:hypothetical protein
MGVKLVAFAFDLCRVFIVGNNECFSKKERWMDGVVIKVLRERGNADLSSTGVFRWKSQDSSVELETFQLLFAPRTS